MARCCVSRCSDFVQARGMGGSRGALGVGGIAFRWLGVPISFPFALGNSEEVSRQGAAAGSFRSGRLLGTHRRAAFVGSDFSFGPTVLEVDRKSRSLPAWCCERLAKPLRHQYLRRSRRLSRSFLDVSSRRVLATDGTCSVGCARLPSWRHPPSRASRRGHGDSAANRELRGTWDFRG